MKREKKQMYEYICPKCKTKIEAEKDKRLPSMYCENCRRSKQLTMLRRILQRTVQDAEIQGDYNGKGI